MAIIKLNNNTFTYTNDTQTRILLDCNDYLSNFSRIPMHAPVAGFALPDFLEKLHLSYDNLFVEGHAPNDGDSYFLIDILLANELIKSSHPIKVVELGCTNGRLSYHLASVLGRFHSDSGLCCVCDSIGNESGNFWLDMISLAEYTPKLSLLASEYNDTNLQGNHFDVVVINGSISFPDTNAIIREARHLVKTNGLIICFTWKQPELTSGLRNSFSHIDSYIVQNNTEILVTHATDTIEEYDKIAEWKSETQKHLAQAEAMLMSNSNKNELLEHIQKLNQDADIATKHQMIDLKLRSLELKEKLLKKYVELE